MTPPETYRFVFLADMQLGAYASFSGLSEEAIRSADEAGLRIEPVPEVEGFEWDARRYEEAVEEVNRLEPRLVLIGGDMLDDPTSEEQYQEFMRITGGIDPSIPVRWVPGNHDAAGDTVVPTADSLARYRDAFGMDFFAFDGGPLRFVALDTVVIDHPEEVPGEWEAQRQFLETELAAAATRGRPVVLIGHHPLFTARPDEEDDYWNVPQERRRVILDLVHRHRVPLMLAGHLHRNAVAVDGGFEMVTAGSVGYPLGDDPSGFLLLEYRDGSFTRRYVPIGG
jgi:3',5'-cyclic AMP phosphodiesterase CpdA